MTRGPKQKSPHVLGKCPRCGGTVWRREGSDPAICTNCFMEEHHPEEWKVYHMTVDEAVNYYREKARARQRLERKDSPTPDR